MTIVDTPSTPSQAGNKVAKITGYKKWTISLYAISAFLVVATYAFCDSKLDAVTKMNIMLTACAGIGGVAAGHGIIEGAIDKMKTMINQKEEKK